MFQRKTELPFQLPPTIRDAKPIETTFPLIVILHGLNRGQKLQNIKNNNKICFEVSNMEGLILDEKACDVNTKYQSIVIFGTAETLDSKEDKIKALNLIVNKYTPQLSGQEYPDNMLKATGILKISIDSITGKFFK